MSRHSASQNREGISVHDLRVAARATEDNTESASGGVVVKAAVDIAGSIAPGPSGSLEAAARRGVAWTSGARIATQFVQFAASVILSRLIAPSEYGLVVIVMAFSTFALLFTDLGLGAAIIHSDDPDDDLLCSAFWLNAVTGVVLTGIVAGLAHPIAIFYGHAELSTLVLLASPVFALSLSTVSLALLERAMQFRRVAFIETGAATGGWVIALVCAYEGAGAKSFIVGNVTQIVITSVAMWLATPWRPRSWGSKRGVLELWSFSSHLFGFNVVNYWSRNLDDLLIGRVSGVTALGLYNRAYGLMYIPVLQVTVSVGRVMFPSLSRLRHDVERLRSGYLRAINILLGVAAPVSVGLSASAVALIELLYGTRWHGSAVLLAVLAASIPAQVVQGTGGALFRAVGLTKSLFRRSLVTTACTVAAILAGFHWGAEGVAVALLIRYYVLLPYSMLPGWRAVGLTYRDLLSGLGPIVACSCLMTPAMLVSGWLVRADPKFFVLLLQGTVGLVVYIGSAAILARDFTREIQGLFRSQRPAP